MYDAIAEYIPHSHDQVCIVGMPTIIQAAEAKFELQVNDANTVTVTHEGQQYIFSKPNQEIPLLENAFFTSFPGGRAMLTELNTPDGYEWMLRVVPGVDARASIFLLREDPDTIPTSYDPSAAHTLLGDRVARLPETRCNPAP